MKHILNIFRVLLIAYIAILIKILLQVFLGTWRNVPRKPINALELFNGKEITGNYILYIVFDEFIIFFFLYYSWIYLILYLVIIKFNNKISIQLLFILLVYIYSVQIFNNDKVAFYPVLIVIIIGILNWWMFKKWIKLK